MEQTGPAPSIFRLADLGQIADSLLRSPSRLRPQAAALLALLAVGLGVLGDALFYHARPGLNLPLWHAALLGSVIAAAPRCGVRLAPRQLALMAASVILSSLIT